MSEFYITRTGLYVIYDPIEGSSVTSSMHAYTETLPSMEYADMTGLAGEWIA